MIFYDIIEGKCMRDGEKMKCEIKLYFILNISCLDSCEKRFSVLLDRKGSLNILD